MLRKNRDFNRLFIMLQEKDKGFGNNGKPSGYLKLEAKEKGVKVSVHIQNIKVLNENNVLKAYLLSSISRASKSLYIGVIEMKGNYGDIVYELDHRELRDKGIDIKQMDTIVITCQKAVPLVGYKNQAWNWESAFVQQQEKRIETDIKTDRKIKLTEHIEEQLVAEREPPQKENILEKEDVIEEMVKPKNEIDKTDIDPQKEDLVSQLSRYEKQEEPFENGALDHHWWRLNDCSFIVNNPYATYQTTFLLYNFPVMNVIHRYGHFLFGVKKDKQNQVKYISYAVPSRYGVDPHPLIQAQAYAIWVPMKEEKSLIGALGYWVVTLDAKSGDIIAMT